MSNHNSSISIEFVTPGTRVHFNDKMYSLWILRHTIALLHRALILFDRILKYPPQKKKHVQSDVFLSTKGKPLDLITDSDVAFGVNAGLCRCPAMTRSPIHTWEWAAAPPLGRIKDVWRDSFIAFRLKPTSGKARRNQPTI